MGQIGMGKQSESLGIPSSEKYSDFRVFAPSIFPSSEFYSEKTLGFPSLGFMKQKPGDNILLRFVK